MAVKTCEATIKATKTDARAQKTMHRSEINREKQTQANKCRINPTRSTPKVSLF